MTEVEHPNAGSPDENTAIAQRFLDAWNERDIVGFEALLHPEFTWHIAVSEHGDPNMRPLHSKLLTGMNMSWDKAIYDKAEMITIFTTIFDATPQFATEARSFTAQDDRVVVELVGNAVNPRNGRRYDNLYCYVFRIRDGQLVLFREYQDTLLFFDVWVAE